MRILLLHPEDTPWRGEWSRHPWDVIVDLSFAGPSTYDDWSRRTGARIFSMYRRAGETESYRWVNQVFELGRGRLLDRMGLDWWEILSMESYQSMQLIYLLEQLRSELSVPDAELFATRPHLFTRLAQQLLGRSIPTFETGRIGPAQRAARTLRSVKNLRPAQIAEISLDKWDLTYRIRRHTMHGKLAHLQKPALLLPSAYSNVTRSVLAYAKQLPHRQFLLATTRRSAIAQHRPENVASVPLAPYAQSADTIATESRDLQRSWKDFLSTMITNNEVFRTAAAAGLWDYFPAHLHKGLLLREAWKNLITSEPISGVLCGDDLNHNTRLPLLLAARSGLRAIYCSHGALDGGFLFKKPVADTYLVKGEMESDYLQRVSAIRPEKIVVAAPAASNAVSSSDPSRDALVFFSQPYEVAGVRSDCIYRELLPGLCSVASSNGRKVVVKLHPFESRRARQALVNSILPRDVQGMVEIVDGRPPEEVMARAWCGITVDSSVAVECALRKIPFFLCGWLDFTGMGYLQQFARFEVACVLKQPQDILSIPQKLLEFEPDPAKLRKLWHAADPASLDQILFGASVVNSPEHVRPLLR